jgi:hypothetical protein
LLQVFVLHIQDPVLAITTVPRFAHISTHTLSNGPQSLDDLFYCFRPIAHQFLHTDYREAQV